MGFLCLWGFGLYQDSAFLNDMNNNEKMPNRNFIISLVFPWIVASLIGFIEHHLPPSKTFFDGFGRLALVYCSASMAMWLSLYILYPKHTRTFSEIHWGAIISGSLGIITGVLFRKIFDYAARSLN